MTVLVFVDTNVLAYSRDPVQDNKQIQATEWLVAIGQSAIPCASFQVLIELYNVVTRRLPRPLGSAEARQLIQGLLQWDPIAPSWDLLNLAWGIQDRFGVSWWDAQIVAAAQLQRCGYLLTEDLQHGQRFGDLTVVSPFQATAAEILR